MPEPTKEQAEAALKEIEKAAEEAARKKAQDQIDTLMRDAHKKLYEPAETVGHWNGKDLVGDMVPLIQDELNPPPTEPPAGGNQGRLQAPPPAGDDSYEAPAETVGHWNGKEWVDKPKK